MAPCDGEESKTPTAWPFCDINCRISAATVIVNAISLRRRESNTYTLSLSIRRMAIKPPAYTEVELFGGWIRELGDRMEMIRNGFDLLSSWGGKDWLEAKPGFSAGSDAFRALFMFDYVTGAEDA